MAARKPVEICLDLDKNNKPKRKTRRFVEDVNLDDYNKFTASVKEALVSFIGTSSMHCKISSIFVYKKGSPAKPILQTSDVLLLQTEKNVRLGIQFSVSTSEAAASTATTASTKTTRSSSSDIDPSSMASIAKKSTSHQTPKGTPRSDAANSPTHDEQINSDSSVDEGRFDMYLTAGVKNNRSNGQCFTLHGFTNTDTIADVKERIASHPFPHNCKPAIDRGLYWQKRAGKDCILLLDEHDWAKAKAVHTGRDGSIADVRLAVAAAAPSRKRTVSSDDEEERTEKVRKGRNDCNQIQASIIKMLNSKGTSDRYTPDHLEVWTELIQGGKLSGPEEEPNWGKYLDTVKFYPRADAPGRKPQPFDLQHYMIFFDERQQKRDEAFRNQMMLMMMAGRAPPVENKPKRESVGLMKWSCAQVVNYLHVNNLGHYSNLFQDADIDGAIMASITDEALKDIGITSAIDRCRIIGKFKQALID